MVNKKPLTSIGVIVVLLVLGLLLTSCTARVRGAGIWEGHDSATNRTIRLTIDNRGWESVDTGGPINFMGRLMYSRWNDAGRYIRWQGDVGSLINYSGGSELTVIILNQNSMLIHLSGGVNEVMLTRR